MAMVLVSSVSPADLHGRSVMGFALHIHTLGSIPPVDFSSVAVALIDVGDKPILQWSKPAGGRTRRRVRAHRVAVAGFGFAIGSGRSDAAPMIVLSRPLDPLLLSSQLRSGFRCRVAPSRAMARPMNRECFEHLQRHAQMDRERAAVPHPRAFLQRSFPECGAFRFTVYHRARGQIGGDFYDVTPLSRDRVLFQIGDVVGPSAAGGLLGNFAARVASMAAMQAPTPSPGELLAEVNRELLRLGMEDPPMVAMAIGVLDANTGQLTLARAGLPAPVLIAATGDAEEWTMAGPFLGTGDTSYPTRTTTFRAGDKLTIGTDGIKPDGDPSPINGGRLAEIAARHRELSGQAFNDAVANDLLADVRHEDDFTLMVVEMKREACHH